MLTPELQTQIIELVTASIEGAYVVEARLKKAKQSVLELRVDTDQGITLDECTKISRTVGKYLEETDPFDFNYSLEVTSPGVGEPLLLTRQYQKEVGRRLRIILKSIAVIEGILKEADNEQIVLELDPPKKKPKNPEEPFNLEKVIRYEDIKEAKVVVVF